MDNILNDPKTAEFVARTAKSLGSYMWEKDLNKAFVLLGIGVQDFNAPPEKRPEQILVYPIAGHISEHGSFGRMFMIGSFRPEAYAEVEQILRNHKYESMDSVSIV